MQNIYEKLNEAGFILPEAPDSVGAFSTAVECDGLLYLSGCGGADPSKLKYYGKLGSAVTIEQGKECARDAVLALLSTAEKYIGSLEKIEKVVKLTGFVNSEQDFIKQPAVIDGASELLIDLFGKEAGLHARSAIGAASLPFNIPVELELILKIRKSDNNE